jgi:CRISPR system Cascade subunit CasB
MTDTMRKAKPRQQMREEFVAMLEGLYHQDDRAALATLRRGLGKTLGKEMGVYRYFGKFTDRFKSRRHEEDYHTLATLFGLYPGESWRVSNPRWGETCLGASLFQLKAAMGDSVERRFVALLNAPHEDLPDYLRQIVGLLKSKEVKLDWAQLLRDLEKWDDEDREVQRKWAAWFWRES